MIGRTIGRNIKGTYCNVRRVKENVRLLRRVRKKPIQARLIQNLGEPR